MDEIIIHIGYGKTGTTAIQGLLFHNQARLRELGVHYPTWRDFGEQPNHTGVAKCLSSQRHARFLDGFLEDCHAATDAKKLIVSGETLSIYPERGSFARPLKGTIDGGAFAARYTPLPDETWIPQKRALVAELKSRLPASKRYRIVCFLRRQDAWLESLYSEDIKGGCVSCGFKDFESYYLNSLHYDKQLDIWADVFGEDSLEVRVYDRSQLPEGVVPAFLQAAGLQDLAAELEEPPETFPNPGLSTKARQFRRVTNGMIKWLPGSIWLRANYWLDGKTMAMAKKERAGARTVPQVFFSPDERPVFMERFEEGNARIAKTWLGRDDGTLFPA